MAWLDAIGQFFGALKPNDWVTAALSLGALVVALTALIGRNGPTPDLRFATHWDDEPQIYVDWNGEPIELEMFNIDIVNRGRGVAYDITVRAPAEDPIVTKELGSLELDKKADGGINAAAIPNDRKRDVLITWTEYPSRKARQKQHLLTY